MISKHSPATSKKCTSPQIPLCKNPRPKLELRLLFLVVLGLWIFQGSCSYKQRFFLTISENQYPCVGVIHFSFIIDDLTAGGNPIVRERVSPNSELSSLFWNAPIKEDKNNSSNGDGQCRSFADGVALKEIPYGGERQLTIKGLDSSGKIVSFGQSPSFLLEPSGESLETELHMDLTRGCQASTNGTCSPIVEMGLATLIVRFQPGSVPFGVGKYEFKLVAASPKPVVFSRTITVQEPTAPTFIILTNMPTGSEKKSFLITAYGKIGNNKLKEWTGEYQISKNPTPQKAIARVFALPKK